MGLEVSNDIIPHNDGLCYKNIHRGYHNLQSYPTSRVYNTPVNGSPHWWSIYMTMYQCSDIYMYFHGDETMIVITTRAPEVQMTMIYRSTACVHRCKRVLENNSLCTVESKKKLDH